MTIVILNIFGWTFIWILSKCHALRKKNQFTVIQKLFWRSYGTNIWIGKIHISWLIQSFIHPNGLVIIIIYFWYKNTKYSIEKYVKNFGHSGHNGVQCSEHIGRMHDGHASLLLWSLSRLQRAHRALFCRTTTSRESVGTDQFSWIC